MRAYIGRLLGAHWDVETVEDGNAAIEAIRRNRPDLVVTDAMMPGLDGFGLLEAIRKNPDLRDLPVSMLSARAGEEARIEGLDAGADYYLTKPFAARELVAQVNRGDVASCSSASLCPLSLPLRRQAFSPTGQ